MITAQIKPRPKLKAVVTRPYQGKGYAEGYEIGKQEEYFRFWNANQDFGNKRNYYYQYAYVWPDDCFNPPYPIICEGDESSGQNIFYYNTAVTRIPVDIIVNGVSARQIFYRCTHLKRVKKLVLNGVTDLTNAFLACNELEEIEIGGIIDVNFNISAAKDLSQASVQSIIDHLAYLTDENTQTLTVHQNVRNAMTDKQVNEVVNVRKWTLAPAKSTS